MAARRQSGSRMLGAALWRAKDKKPLGSQHLDRLAGAFSEDGSKEARKTITREGFEEWLENYKDNSVESGRSDWENVGSLYDL
jgi:hypothetical protein